MAGDQHREPGQWAEGEDVSSPVDKDKSLSIVHEGFCVNGVIEASLFISGQQPQVSF